MSTKVSEQKSGQPQLRVKMWQILGRTNVDFMSKRYYAFALSCLLIVLGIVASLQVFVLQGANLGLEFTGGTSVEISFSQPVAIDVARKALSAAGFSNAQIQSVEGDKTLIITIKTAENEVAGAVSQTPDQIKSLMEQAFPGNAASVRGSHSIGPTVGSELRQKAIYASLYAMLGILVYIAVRFDYKFGVAALISTLHDILAVMGLVWVINFIYPTEITMLILTAILTLAGYSLTDKVVVFDRIRENLKKRQRMPLAQLLNTSINQVLSRTIVTSLTVLLVVLALLFLGGEVLRGFSLAMSMGVIVGTYSSIFIASPILLIWRGGSSRLLGRATAVSTGKSSKGA
jgi:preprotein translocase subunit SecF